MQSVCVCVQQDKEDHTLDSCRVLYSATCRVQCWRSPRGRARAAAELITHCRSALFLFFFTHRVRLHSTLGRSQGEGSQVWREVGAGHQGRSRDMKALALLCTLRTKDALSEIFCGVWCQRGFLKHRCLCCLKKPLVLHICGYAFNTNGARPKFWFIIDDTTPEERHNLNQKHHLTHSGGFIDDPPQKPSRLRAARKKLEPLRANPK